MATDTTWTCPDCGESWADTTNVCHNCGRNKAAAEPARSSIFVVVLRWLAVLPAALLASGISITIYDVLRPFVASYGGIMFFTDIIASGGMGAFFVAAGSKVAPTKHIAVRIILAILYIAAVVYLLVLTNTNGDFAISPRWGGPHWMVYVQVAAAMVGSVVAVVADYGE